MQPRIVALTLVSFAGFSMAALAQAPPAKEQLSESKKAPTEEIQQLINQLGDEDFAKRKSARSEILAIGEPALGLLQKAAESAKDLDVKTAAAELINEIEKKASGLVRTFTGHRSRVNGVSIDAEGKRALSASYDGTLRLWNLENGEVIKEMRGHESGVTTVTFAADGKRALTGAHDRKMCLWDLDKGEIVRTFEGHENSVWDVVFSPDGKKALSGCSDGKTRLWDLESGKELLTMSTQENGRAWTAAFTPDGKYAVAGGGNLMMRMPPAVASLRLWDLKTGQEIRQFKGHTADVRRVAISADGKQMLSGSFDGTMRLWEIETGKEVKVFKGTGHFVEAVAFTKDGKRAICSYGPKVLEAWLDEDVRCSLRVWDLASGKELKVIRGHTGPILSLALSSNGRFMVSGSGDQTMRLWHVPK